MAWTRVELWKSSREREEGGIAEAPPAALDSSLDAG